MGRKAGNPSDSMWIDADVHILEPPAVYERVDREFRKRIEFMPLVKDEYYGKMMPDVFIDGTPIPSWIGGPREPPLGRAIESFKKKFPTRGSGQEPEQFLKDFDIEGIEQAVIYPTFFLWAPWLPRAGAKFSAALARAYNDFMYDFCATDRRRLKPVVVVAMHDVGEAIREVKRNAERGFVGVFSRPNPLYGRTLGHPDYFPLYDVMQDLSLPLGIHEGTCAYLPTCGLDRVNTQAMQHVVCHPFEQMAAIVSMMENEVFKRFPKLQVLYLEAGSAWLPYWLHRLDAERKQYRSGESGLLPSEYFRRQCFVSSELEDPFIDHTVALIGDANIVLSGDYPHDESTFPESHKLYKELKVSDETRHRLGRENPVKAYPRLREGAKG